VDERGRKVGTFSAEDPNGERYTVIVYETAQPSRAAGGWRLLQRRFVTSDGQELQQHSSHVFRIVPDGLTLTAVF
jgi:hypothetical protein